MTLRTGLLLAAALFLLAGPAAARTAPSAPAVSHAKIRKAGKTARRRVVRRPKAKRAPKKFIFKTRLLSEDSSHHYLFDANGNPIDGSAKKRSSAARRKKAAIKPACSTDDSCSDLKSPASSDADAL
ncbi:MAG: hypothetical protein KGM24_01160 [Elusimicrobia bacterium]|nr:hypothetical protein [Elusimicrobiota bacterium]